jgi:hypothetical protein
MQSKIGYNVLSTRDKNTLFDHSSRLNPSAMLFYSFQGEIAQQFKARFPRCVVIVRDYPDEEIWLKETPTQWLDKRQHLAANGVYLYTSNEPGLSDELVKWHVELMELCVNRNVHLVVLNFSVGYPSPEQLFRCKRIFELAALYRNLFVIGLHEYAGGVITSGLIGGTPDQVIDKVKPNFIPVENWPMNASNITRFHMGRYKFVLDYCSKNNIPKPRIIITEWGFDFLGDIGNWLNNLVKTHPYVSINGWRTLVNQWLRWFPQWEDAQDALYFQAKWAETVLYTDVEALLFFAWSDDDNWPAFDLSKAFGLHKRLESTSAPTNPPPPPDPVPEVYPDPRDPRWLKGIVRSNAAVHVRASRSITSSVVGAVRDGQPVLYIDDDEFGDWYPIKSASGTSIFGYSRRDVIGFDPPPTSEFTYPVPPPHIPVTAREAVAATLYWLSDLIRHLADWITNAQ